MNLTDAQQRARKAAEQAEVPTFKYGLSLHLSTRDVKLDGDGNVTVTTDSHGDVTVTNWSDATERQRRTLRGHLLELYPVDVHKLSLYHVASVDNVVLVHARDDATVKIHHELDGTACVHVVVIADANTDVTVTERVTGEGRYCSTAAEAYAKQGATVTYEALHDTDAWQFTVKRGQALQDAQIDWFTAALGEGVDKTEVSTEITGEGGETRNYGLYYGRGTQRFDIYNQSSHEAPHTRSDMKNKGVVADRSKGIYRGLVDIGEDAHDSQGYQTEDALILSDQAEADAVPNLEIKNNDVQCSHGATIGRVDEAQLYYMQTRGLTKEDARRAIIRGFLYSMTEHVHDDALREDVEDAVEERL